ncbi:putative monofunctional riboflavin biosynthesis protein RIBA 3, chloroplastic [Glycine soja]|uniref:GTP cyclohydrolase II n=2 Tax=Glycine subgen. Soja TaxID=1462606 RepID=A0A0R0H605_SOYBN|nr:putative monofunctional riboflavin biosynthesis protein RIBA 3, chloroplastic isoform A [Glycine soja]RZB84147.1 putative monofunctional riboflavin biosynthesis protein RIBA 3, chloroplastic isoform B [Glycine soja]
MDTSFPHPLISHVITSSSLHRSYGIHHSARLGLWKNKVWNSACCAVGFSGVGIEDVFDDSNLKINENGSLLGALNNNNESSSASFETLDSEITPETTNFFVSDAEGDPDCPSKGYSSIEQALNALSQGKFVIVVDDENGDVEGNLIMAASLTSPKDIAFMIKHGSGIVSVGMKDEDLQRLNLPLMSPETEDEDSSAPTFSGFSCIGWLAPKLASEHTLPIGSITDLIRYRRKREKLVERTSVSRLPTKWGVFQAYCYSSKLDGTEHVAAVKGDIGDGQDVLVRVHSECLTGDIVGSARCDCGNQLDLAMRLIEEAGRGVVVYLRGHEGRGIELGHKLKAYNLQDQGHDTVQANIELGLAVDAREYGIGAQILRDIGVRTMWLMTNNPAKFVGLKGYGLAVLTPITEENKRYLETKRTKMGHIYGSDLQGSLPGFNDSIVNNGDSPVNT